MRVKKMPRQEFDRVLELEWDPVQLADDAIPGWAKNIPADVLFMVAASGTAGPGEAYNSKNIPSGTLIGGIDVWRHAPDDPVGYNKDWYAVVSVDGQPLLLVDGPIADLEHWSDELPARLHNLQIMAVPKMSDP